MSTDVIYEFNVIINSYGIEEMYLKKNLSIDGIHFIGLYFRDNDGEDEIVYYWRNKKDFIAGNSIRYNIFELCERLTQDDSRLTNHICNDKCFNFCKFVSRCKSLEEIKLKMQLIGI
jgi:hypothetical protein